MEYELKQMDTIVRDCFVNALKSDKKGNKHKGLLISKPDDAAARDYILKSKVNLRECDHFKEIGLDYKIPEEWFYALYYCALAILSKFGITSRSQKCTAAFLRYVKDKGLIDYDDKFIDRITVYSSKNEKSLVDNREEARYGSSIKIEEVAQKYDAIIELCKEAISQAEAIVFSEEVYQIPEELYGI